jgi:hypothetical protein
VALTLFQWIAERWLSHARVCPELSLAPLLLAEFPVLIPYILVEQDPVCKFTIRQLTALIGTEAS